MTLREMLPILLPILLVQLTLIIFALRDLLKPERHVRGGNKWVWGLVIVFANMLGPILYFLLGREEA